MVVLTQRDNEIIQAVTTLKALTSTQIERLFYSSQQAQSKRCKELVNHKNLKRFRINNWTPYIYYIGKVICDKKIYKCKYKFFLF